MSRRTVVEEAVIQMKNLEDTLKENAKGILASTMRQEINSLVKESLKEEDEVDVEDEEEVVEPEGGEEDVEDEETFDVDDESDEEMDGEEMDMDDEEMDMDDEEMDMDDEEMDMDDEETIDLRGASDSEVATIFSKMGPSDTVSIEKIGDFYNLKDSEHDAEYLFKLNEQIENLDMAEETIYELEVEDGMSFNEGDVYEEMGDVYEEMGDMEPVYELELGSDGEGDIGLGEEFDMEDEEFSMDNDMGGYEDEEFSMDNDMGGYEDEEFSMHDDMGNHSSRKPKFNRGMDDDMGGYEDEEFSMHDDMEDDDMGNHSSRKPKFNRGMDDDMGGYEHEEFSMYDDMGDYEDEEDEFELAEMYDETGDMGLDEMYHDMAEQDSLLDDEEWAGIEMSGDGELDEMYMEEDDNLYYEGDYDGLDEVEMYEGGEWSSESEMAFKKFMGESKVKTGNASKFKYSKKPNHEGGFNEKMKEGSKRYGKSGKAKFDYDNEDPNSEIVMKIVNRLKKGKKSETKEASRTHANMRKVKRGLMAAPRHLKEEVEVLRQKNDEYRKALDLFRTKLTEVAVFNSNLAYATRLFTEHSTTKQEKINILRRFDGVESLKESKNLYRSIKNELTTDTLSEGTITESFNRSVMKAPSSGSAVSLIESKTYENPQFMRMKDLMGKIK